MCRQLLEPEQFDYPIYIYTELSKKSATSTSLTQAQISLRLRRFTQNNDFTLCVQGQHCLNLDKYGTKIVFLKHRFNLSDNHTIHVK